MRLMSFSLTTAQVRAREKTVTRRCAWHGLKSGTQLRAVEKAMGLKKGESPVDIAVIEVVSVRAERVDSILLYEDAAAEVAREGFPDLTPAEFVEMFVSEFGVKPTDPVRRIEFRYLEGENR